MTSLQQLDALLALGTQQLPPAFRARQRDWVLGQQRPDGSFPGRQGAGDLYYTDFALRLLWLLEAPEALARAGEFVSTRPPPRDLVELFGGLNCRRLLREAAGQAPSEDPLRSDARARDQAADAARLGSDPALADLLHTWVLPGGGFAKSPGGPLSAYACFLAGLCAEMLGGNVPAPGPAARQLMALQGPGGGFRELADPGPQQVSATAAAVGFLGLVGGLADEVGRAAAAFLAGRQTPAGGLAAHEAIPAADLLSTFTGLVALLGLPGEAAVDLGALARFAAGLALPGGGFAAWPGDDEGDLEYTYYGLATLALLRAILPPE